jgi:hypothetical protein
MGLFDTIREKAAELLSGVTDKASDLPGTCPGRRCWMIYPSRRPTRQPSDRRGGGNCSGSRRQRDRCGSGRNGLRHRGDRHGHWIVHRHTWRTTPAA